MPNMLAALRQMKEPITIQQMIEKKYEMAMATGHIGRDPEVRHTASGKSICKTSMAVSWGKRGDPDQRTEWIELLAWERDAEILAGFKKGDAIQVAGKLSTNTWTGRGGVERVTGQITAWTIARPIYQSAGNGESDNRATKSSEATNDGAEPDPDIPF